ncbi:hypothetical protein Tco_0554462, partial [Tanacetum coccineum]
KEKSKVVRAQWTQVYIDIMSPKVNNVPLKEEDHNSWLEFKKLDEGRKDKISLYHSEVSSCKYMNAHGFYYFYLRIEGIEAGILGVYEVRPF